MALASLLYELLVAGSTLLAKSAAGEFAKSAGKAAFEKLCDKLSSEHNVKTLGLLAEAPEKPGYQAAIKGDLSAPEISNDVQVLELAEELREAIESLPEHTTAAYAIDADTIRAGGSQIFSAIQGIRAGRIEADEDQIFEDVSSPGKRQATD